MPKIEVRCPECTRVYTADAELVSRWTRCKSCDTWFELTAPLETAEPSGATEALVAHPPDDTAVSSPQSEKGVAEVWNEGDVILDLYEVKEILGEGGFGTVHRVRHRGWNRDLAVKSPKLEHFKSERQKENFIVECQTWVELGLHPHTTSCYYVRNLGGIPRVFAECVEAGSLRDWVRNGRLYEGGPEESLRRILDIAIQSAWGLHYAHEQGLVHQDVKPANVLITPGGLAKITDFGLAKARGSAAVAESQASSDCTMLVPGGGYTPAYASPEQFRREPLTRRTDVWSWAVSLLEMFLGRRPGDVGIGAPKIMQQVLEGDEQYKPRVPIPPLVAELLRGCFEQDPGGRPHDMHGLAVQLQEVYRTVTGSDHAREQPKAIDLRADALNNRGVSLWDLGKMEEAETAFEEALKFNTQHPRATMNLGLLRWRNVRSTDTQILTQLSEIRRSRADDWEIAYVAGLVHLERLDAKNAVENLEEAQRLGGGQEVEAALEEARRIVPYASRCVRTFDGHTHHVNSVTFSPDGRFCLSGSVDKTLRLWDASTGQCVQTFEGHAEKVTSVAFSPDGRFCLSGSWDWMLRLWDASTGRCVRTFEGHDGAVESAIFSPDGRFCLSQGRDETLRLWDVSTSRCVRTFEGSTGPVESLAFSPDGRFALSGSRDKTLQLWDVQKGQRLHTFEGHTDRIESVAFSPDGQFCLSGSWDRTLRLWGVSTGQCVRTFEGHTDHVNSVAFSPDGRFCLSGSGLISATDYTLRLWDASTGQCVRTFEGHAHRVSSVAFSPDGRFCLSGSWDKTLRLWNVCLWYDRSHRIEASPSEMSDSDEATRKDSEFLKLLDKTRQAHAATDHSAALEYLKQARDLPGRDLAEKVLDWNHSIGKHCTKRTFSRGWMKRTFEGDPGFVSCVAFSPDGRSCLARGGGYDLGKTLRLWDVSTGRCVRTFEGHSGSVNSVAFSPDGRRCLSGSGDKTLRLWDASTGQCVRTFEGHTGGVTSVAFGPVGHRCLSSSQDKTLRLWDASTGQCVRTFEGNTANVSSVAFSPDGRSCLARGGGYDLAKTLRLWDVSTGRCVRTFEGHSGSVNSVAFSPDGRSCLSGSGSVEGKDTTLRLWDASTGQCVRTFEGHTKQVTSVAFSPDGSFCLSGSWDKTLRLWDASTGQCVRTFEGFSGNVYSVAFSPDGRFCLSGTGGLSPSDNRLRLWEFDWEYEFPGWADWDDRARPYLENFLTLHSPHGDDGIACIGKPTWTKKDFQTLLIDLQHRGYGWLREEGVRKKLEEMAANWQGPPPLPCERNDNAEC